VRAVLGSFFGTRLWIFWEFLWDATFGSNFEEQHWGAIVGSNFIDEQLL
jgi:hypothetical protein